MWRSLRPLWLGLNSKALYAAILGITQPWKVEKVDLQLQQGEVHVWVALPPKTRWVCPICQERAPIHDHKERAWRHLDTCQYKTILHARVPRLDCPNHGTKQLEVPWAEERSRFTALFEALVIDWLKQATLQAVGSQLRLSWDEVSGIMERAVKRGLARRRLEPVAFLGVDETSFRRRHRYVTVVSDLEEGRVLDVQDHRRKESLDAFWAQWPEGHKEAIVAVAMDMCEPYIQSTRKAVPGAEEKIVFDKFHVAKNLGDALDRVRRQEHRQLLAEGKPWLKGTKYDWLRHPSRFSDDAYQDFITKMHRHRTKTARAWSLKEFFMGIYTYLDTVPADVQFKSWYQWARRSRLEPFKKLALTFRKHWRNIRTYFKHRITNAGSETINSMIQRVKVMARGFRNPERFRMAILFHCGGLKLYPARDPDKLMKTPTRFPELGAYDTPGCAEVPVRVTTWGRLKAMYQ